MKNISLCLLMLFTIAWADGNAQTLIVGDPAPPIVARKWIKGNPVTNFKPGMVYVVEFWATWCGPCQSAMPHLSELARKYKGKAEVISIDVKEDKKTDFLPKVERFVKWSGDRMDYAVAVDDTDDIMQKTWLTAAGSNGIPHLFIVDQQGKIAWHGHPNHMDDVLDAVVNGEYDEAGKKRLEAALKKKEELYDSLGKRMMTARKNGDYKTALAAVEDMFHVFPGMRTYFTSNKYEFLSHIDSAKARQYGDDAMAQLSPKDQLYVAFFVLSAQSEGSYHPDYGFALKWLKLAAAKSDPEDKGVMATLAQAYYKTGNKKEAVKYQEKYIQMMKKDPGVKPAWIEQAEKTLAQYKDCKVRHLSLP
jgi:thiol-disulfide isomerase/thioredoxin